MAMRSVLDQLKALRDLRDDGTITEEEFIRHEREMIANVLADIDRETNSRTRSWLENQSTRDHEQRYEEDRRWSDVIDNPWPIYGNRQTAMTCVAFIGDVLLFRAGASAEMAIYNGAAAAIYAITTLFTDDP
uniref:SHOCT domain-containing protein n=1 Tax=Spongospora subterranea TaxID=70186 RepID=A0A0H5RVX2_9EUKA|eukprot:CRZ12899.1 hypothetical protein [Spongospora subterranea]